MEMESFFLQFILYVLGTSLKTDYGLFLHLENHLIIIILL